ncbi:hypothetical protein BSZ39_09265 [Bowdeniella nasicola]|uniref:NADP-dependent oxidoreductase domain-containing protein n=2 Tax=Bowdeniella nasicola TaxID=208480 RepID=A0A1Q5Q119_9ACTO|nr:aldo/keto reductase [Bowdeniella nasicola]OKL53497.1 hypothetical protein BSZ39_09265 [Bowdeniella nasicola]
MRTLGIPAMAYSPIEQGRLFDGEGGRRLAEIARKVGYSPAALALAWVMRDGNTVAIPKAGTVEHMKDNLAALDVELTEDLLAELNAAFPAPAEPVPLETL